MICQRPAQQQLRLDDPRYLRPTMGIGAARGILDISEDEITALLDEGRLTGWNIATPKSDRRELRILTTSVAYVQGSGPDGEAWQQPAFKELLIIVYPPHEKPFFTTREICWMFNCGATHVINLVETRCLKTVAKSSWRRGPGGCACVARESFTDFLRERLEGGSFE